MKKSSVHNSKNHSAFSQDSDSTLECNRVLYAHFPFHLTAYDDILKDTYPMPGIALGTGDKGVRETNK